MEDECHLLWGERNVPIPVSMTNERERQTYYGAVNLLTHDFHLQPLSAGTGQNTVTFLRWLRDLYPGKTIILLWDGASYHRDVHLKALLTELNQGRSEEAWSLVCLPFAPNAP